VLQRTPEWFAARCGCVTASRMKDVLATLADPRKEATTRRNYRRELVLEQFSNRPQESSYMSFAMQQGLEKEETARNAYAFEKNVEVIEAGFIAHPTIKNAGASPDGFIGSDGLLELKCPEANAMYEMLIKSPLDKAYRDQVMFQLACTHRKWADVAFYREGLPLEIVRIDRDQVYIDIIEAEVRKFLAEVEAELTLLRKHQKQ